MYCPQCGTESTSDLKYCRSCGTNLKVIGKAVTLSDAISRSDGVPAKIKELMSNIKIAHVTEEVSRAMEKMNKEIVRSTQEPSERRAWWEGKKKTPEQRRERHLVSGTIKLFWGGGLTIFLYYLAHALVLKLPPEAIAKIPFEIDPVVHVLWLLGLIPMLSGVGHIIAGLSIKPGRAKEIEVAEPAPLRIDAPEASGDQYRAPIAPGVRDAPPSVTDRTTNILEHRVRKRQTNEIEE